ncbi:MAG: hypothetical protein RL020_1185, partial [Pseudomonadota bacterium]
PIHATDIPLHAFVGDLIAATQSIENFQCALGMTNAARADADRVVVVEQNGLDAMQREISRADETNRTRTDDDDAMMRGFVRALLGRGNEIKNRLFMHFNIG